MPSMTTSNAALSVRRDRDAVLVVLAVTEQTQICILDPQARAPAATACQLLHFHATAISRARRFIHRATHPCKTAFALISTLNDP